MIRNASRIIIPAYILMVAVLPLRSTATMPASETVLTASRPAWNFAGECFGNPAVDQFRLPISVSSGGFTGQGLWQDATIDPQQGSGGLTWGLDAATYMKHRSSTLRGAAGYTSGRSHDIRWNESADADLIYPYLSADSIGGDLRSESYSFMGSYADHRGRWGWGGQLSYDAGQHYRAVDPRPRNVTSRLDLTVGGAFRFAGNYMAGLSVDYRKYKQTNSIAFYSEMGKAKVYHLTGLGTHYARFAGAADNAYFNGHRAGGAIQLYPTGGNGAFLSVSLRRFSFEKILTGLNNLPLAEVAENQLSAEAGWQRRGNRLSWGAKGYFRSSRRNGTENLFGDGTASVYPQIGSLEMFRDDRRDIGFGGFIELAAPGRRLTLLPAVGHAHRLTTYANPSRRMLADSWSISATLEGARLAGRNWLLTGSLSASLRTPLDSSLELPGSSPDGLVRTIRDQSSAAQSNMVSYSASIAAIRNLHRNLGLAIGLTLNCDDYTDIDLHSDKAQLSLRIIF
ncbi:MAG: hypothetical protein NC336_01100 [Clostridium sp.]|nr:hypothetical protein [Clostridium sp.]